MANILEYRRKSIKLRKRLEKRLQRNTCETYVDQLKCNAIDIPFAAEKWAHVIPKFLTQKECDGFIDFLYKNRLMQSRDERRATKPKQILSSSERMRPRGLAWTINKSKMISELIFDRCFDFLPKVWLNEEDNSIWEVCGINNDVKSLKYGPGDVLCSHYDAPYVKNENERSFITTVLYLNDDFVGGCFQFVNPKKECMIHPVQIKKGTCLMFQHNTFHQASSVEEGTKYMIRFDILYKRVQPIKQNLNGECRSCIWL